MNTLLAPENETLVAPPDGAEAEGPAPDRMDASRFRVTRQIGAGGMATIHLAVLPGEGGEPDRQVALKLMHSHLTADPSLKRRFEHEVRAQAGLKHPNVVELIGWGQDAGGRLFMAMELIDGPVLKDLVIPGRRFPADLAAWVTRCMLLGLQAAHARRIVHRDVKPANVMTTLDGRVKVADFGISKAADMTKLTSTGNVIGTPAYMSPEQALARPIDGRSDLFSVGVSLYEMLTGVNPFQTGNPATTLSRVVHFQQRPAFETLPQTPALLDELLETLLSKDPAKRFKDAAEALALLDRCIAENELAATQEAFAAFLKDPDVTTRRLNARRARRHFERGARFYQAGKGNAEAAVWEFFLATLLDPSDEQARTWLEQVSKERGYNLQRKANARIDELEAQLKDNPDNLAVVMQLAKLHKAQGNFLQVIYYYKRAKALRPPDNYTRTQLETLVSAQAASLLDGTNAFETKDHVPVRLRAVPAPVPEPERAEGVGDFVRGVLSTTWGKAGLAASLLAGVVLLAGSMFDRAAVAAGRGGRREATVAEPELDRQSMMIEKGRVLDAESKHAEAEKVWRSFLDDYPGSSLRSEALFRLGDSLERQGRRPEALEVHAQNAAENEGEWALKSLDHRGEMLAIEGDLTGARLAYEAIARGSDGETQQRAQLALAGLAVRDGRPDDARREYEDVLGKARDAAVADDARLGYADMLSAHGDTERARGLYAEVRDHADHRGAAFSRAAAGLAALESVPAPAVTPGSEPAPLETTAEPPAPEPPLSEPAPAAPGEEATAPSEPPATGLLTGLGGNR